LLMQRNGLLQGLIEVLHNNIDPKNTIS
jgi:hypothetical protein